MAQNTLFIGGTGRSGTTILKKVLAKHPQIAWVPEWRGTLDPMGLIHFYVSTTQIWSPFIYDHHLKELERVLISIGKRSIADTALLFFLSKTGLSIPKTNRKLTHAYYNIKLSKWSPNYLKLVDDLIAQLTDFKYKGQWLGMPQGAKAEIRFGLQPLEKELQQILGGFLTRVIEDICQAQQKTTYLDDNTWNVLFFDRLQLMLPNAKLIHMYRDPRDNVSSLLGQGWAPDELRECCTFYKSLVDGWRQVKQRIPSDSFIEISLENLAASPTQELQKLCAFASIDWHESLLDTPLNKTNSGRWKRELSKSDQTILESELSDVLIELGYE